MYSNNEYRIMQLTKGVLFQPENAPKVFGGRAPLCMLTVRPDPWLDLRVWQGQRKEKRQEGR